MSLPRLPTLDELANPSHQDPAVRTRALAERDPLAPINLFRLTWEDAKGEIPHVVLPRSLTGTDAHIVVMSACDFPTGSHKVGPAYSCLREKILDHGIRPGRGTLVFPSTGNYGIGGAWVGPRTGFASRVVLPADMSRERFEKIRSYGADVIATPGSESNVKEIYDKVNELKRDPDNVILNQFADFGNYRYHRHVTGGAARKLTRVLAERGVGDGRVSAFVSAMGSAGTIAAADELRVAFPEILTVGLEPIQCPTMFNVGYGAHAIEGIGDKHVTWIHNVRALDALMCIDDEDCLLGLDLLQNGLPLLKDALGDDTRPLSWVKDRLGISSVCNILGAIRTARHFELPKGSVVFTVATDGFDRYPSVLERLHARRGELDQKTAERRLRLFRDPRMDYVLEGTMSVRRRWHNQKYFTWVEQQGMTLEALEALWEPAFWAAEAAKVPDYDARTRALNAELGHGGTA